MHHGSRDRFFCETEGRLMLDLRAGNTGGWAGDLTRGGGLAAAAVAESTIVCLQPGHLAFFPASSSLAVNSFPQFSQ